MENKKQAQEMQARVSIDKSRDTLSRPKNNYCTTYNTKTEEVDDPINLEPIEKDDLIRIVTIGKDLEKPVYQCYSIKILYNWIQRDAHDPLTRGVFDQEQLDKIEDRYFEKYFLQTYGLPPKLEEISFNVKTNAGRKRYLEELFFLSNEIESKYIHDVFEKKGDLDFIRYYLRNSNLKENPATIDNIFINAIGFNKRNVIEYLMETPRLEANRPSYFVILYGSLESLRNDEKEIFEYLADTFTKSIEAGGLSPFDLYLYAIQHYPFILERIPKVQHYRDYVEDVVKGFSDNDFKKLKKFLDAVEREDYDSQDMQTFFSADSISSIYYLMNELLGYNLPSLSTNYSEQTLVHAMYFILSNQSFLNRAQDATEFLEDKLALQGRTLTYNPTAIFNLSGRMRGLINEFVAKQHEEEEVFEMYESDED
jgi:hypothetical protein